MLQLSQCKLSWQEDSFSKLQKKAAKLLGISVEDFTQFTIVKRSLDARKKPNLFVLYTVRFLCRRESEVLKRNRKNKNLTIAKKEPSLWRQIEEIKNPERVAVVGAGPAGLFSAYYLSLCGYSPIVIERGAKMEERHDDILKFWQEGVLKPDSNVAFGEGGAGTFSDGKLNTGVKDKTGRKQFVLQSFVNFGAPEEILYDAKPHIGTDILQEVVKNMRQEIRRLGGLVYFETKFEDFEVKDGVLSALKIRQAGLNETIRLDAGVAVLALGHSARDSFQMLYEGGLSMSAKEFAVLMPNYDIFSARNLAESIQKQILHMRNDSADYKLKILTVSVGISAAPYAARSAKELLDNADLAVYHVKRSGKNGIEIFDTMLKESLDEENAGKKSDHEHIYQSYESTIYALTAAIDTKDHYTFGHSNNVAYYATSLAKALNYTTEMVEIIRQAALLHDVGKIGIPEHILNKEGKLTDEEYEIMKGHVEASIGIIRHLPSLDYVIPAVIGHHERYDGNGYPRRIAGEDIPASARILCIADSFDAMTSKRCYKELMPVEKALRIIREEEGKQFDPDMAEVFIHIFREGKIHLAEPAELKREEKA